MAGSRRSNVIIIHPDLGIGGAERLIIDVALALQKRGHQVTIYTSHRDKAHCFEEARDGTLDVRGDGENEQKKEEGKTTDTKGADEEFEDDVFIIDQLPACVPILKTLGPRCAATGRNNGRRRGKQRILFYCHFPDQLLARRDERSALMRLLKGLYRYPFDWFEGWAMSASDKVVANSKFTRGVVRQVFGAGKLGDVKVVYPCVDTDEAPVVKKKGADKVGKEEAIIGDDLWGGKKIFLSINRFERKKGIELAIRTYHGLGKEGRKGTRLVIAGGYDNRVQENVQYHKELDALAQDLGLQTATSNSVISALSIPDSIDVLFLLSVPTAFKQTLLHNAKLLLYTPVNEHFGIVPVEAMHAGLPVLASNTGGPLETIVEGETGWLRDARNVDEWTAIMRKVLFEMDDQDFARMAANGKKRAKDEFSLTALGDRLEEEIQDMLASRRRPFMGFQQLAMGFVLSGIGVAILAAAILRTV
ncbi:Alpha-1,2-mannosyltransferase (Alg2) [Rasamsonia emersonii CBS 393.64]|uniref:Alpha-1,3/1,6-mannosyltransferase ALG2 n=1 Tax=Rasamsonia emersonii (strain ATCC 16479 / CBS 393.64 / IMI 116815) TaxID=1408163 RepID=A0A0F4Z147_RASE3|nr:Alpha-1,2-mannosyltransferase (Alg2) [Rasamsonia emersonii CBS 393.64]KKA24095.1 Alpha-1,2-mannosyltransferase (Alg2) [Rasamsonia emersonii CBS 393.64]